MANWILILIIEVLFCIEMLIIYFLIMRRNKQKKAILPDAEVTELEEDDSFCHCLVCHGKITPADKVCPNCGFCVSADVTKHMSLCRLSEDYKQELSDAQGIINYDIKHKSGGGSVKAIIVTNVLMGIITGIVIFALALLTLDCIMNRFESEILIMYGVWFCTEIFILLVFGSIQRYSS